MITTLTKQISITSLNKAIDRSKIYGKLDLSIINLYNIIIYYIEFTEGINEYNNINKYLKQLISKLKYKYSDILCNYKLRFDNTNIITRTGNTAPTVDGKTIDLNGENMYSFTLNDFITNYQDNEGDPYNKVIVYPPLSNTSINNSKLYYYTINGLIPITSPTELEQAKLSNLRYIHDVSKLNNPQEDINKEEVNDSFKFKISDISNYGSLYSENATITIINSAYQNNFPPIIGDITVYADNRVTTILTLDMFTNQMQPPYSDPENDDIDAIRIDYILPNGSGQFLFDNNPLQVGNVITKEQLESNLFIHIGADTDSLGMNELRFSARDRGSMEWVQ